MKHCFDGIVLRSEPFPRMFLLLPQKKTDLIKEIDAWVIKQVCQHIKKMSDHKVQVAVNLSLKTLESEELEQFLIQSVQFLPNRAREFGA